jgi:hypothetical protein
MGRDVAARVFSRADRQRYREKVRGPRRPQGPSMRAKSHFIGMNAMDGPVSTAERPQSTTSGRAGVDEDATALERSRLHSAPVFDRLACVLS